MLAGGSKHAGVRKVKTKSAWWQGLKGRLRNVSEKKGCPMGHSELGSMRVAVP